MVQGRKRGTAFTLKPLTKVTRANLHGPFFTQQFNDSRTFKTFELLKSPGIILINFYSMEMWTVPVGIIFIVCSLWEEGEAELVFCLSFLNKALLKHTACMYMYAVP